MSKVYLDFDVKGTIEGFFFLDTFLYDEIQYFWSLLDAVFLQVISVVHFFQKKWSR